MKHGCSFSVKTGAFAIVVALAAMQSKAQVNTESARAVIEQAAQALGGIDRVRSIRNITLYGYGQYAVMEQSISPSRYAPMRYQAANDLRRVYDLEHDRFQMLERLNMLYPYRIKAGHAFLPNNLVLDGDIAYNVTSEFTSARRAPRWNNDLYNDPPGVHSRRMWMLNNPIALVRAAMDSATQLSAPRREGAYTVLDMTLKQGDHLSAGFSADHLPAWVRWSSPYTNLGEVTFTTYMTGYASIDGIELPLGYDTRLDWRDIDYFKLYVDGYRIDQQIADLAAPADIRSLPEPPSFEVHPISAEPIAPHLWRLSPDGTTVIEFKDHITLFELAVQGQQAKKIIEFASTLAPGKPVTQVIVSHHHLDHSAGVREAVASGLTIISRRHNEGIIREMVSHPDPDFPDDLAKSPRPLKFVPVDERLRLSDDTMTVDVLWTRNSPHMAEGLVVFAPAQKVIMEADIATAGYDYQFWPDTFHDIIDYYKLDVQKDSPLHSVLPEHPGVLTIEQVDELIKAGTARARERCAAELSKDNYFPGCPVQSKRY
jgi:glyoxylase-like metal-dependent hydrolase (beta-lactamase superfamily II)